MNFCIASDDSLLISNTDDSQQRISEGGGESF